MSANAYRGDASVSLDSETAIGPQNYADDTTDIDGTGVDLTPSENQYHGVRFHVHTNNGNASDDLTFTVQESSDDGSSDAYSDLSDADGNTITGQITSASGSIQIDVLGNLKHEQFLRLKLKSGDATLGGASVDVAATATKLGKKYS